MEYLKDLSDAVASTRKPIVAAVVGLAVRHALLPSLAPFAFFGPLFSPKNYRSRLRLTGI
jgi:hypothetical protein